MANRWWERLTGSGRQHRRANSWITAVTSGSLYRVSDIRGDTSFSDIRTQITTMRALAADSQISTALSYYATDATTANSDGRIIWATPSSDDNTQIAETVNALFDRWRINTYVRDHILELATIGNLYIPTTAMYRQTQNAHVQRGVALDKNNIVETDFDIVPSSKIRPETIVHLWYQGEPKGYLVDPDDNSSDMSLFPEAAVIHFSLGGLLGDYTLMGKTKDGDEVSYDIQFAQPLMDRAVQPTQTLSLLEDAMLLASLSRTIKFINVDAGSEEEEIRDSLQQIKDAIEQQLALNTTTGDVQSFVNPQSPNNLIYLPKVNGQDAISVTDLNMAEANESESKLLQYYQDKKLSVLGVPKEAMNFSSNEGLGGAGSVLSQRSALYANSLQRLMTAYMDGWKNAIDTYFTMRGFSGFAGQYKLHMNPIITQQSTIQAERRDAALNQASQIVDLLKGLGVKDTETYTTAIAEILLEAFPQIGSSATGWKLDVNLEGGNNAI